IAIVILTTAIFASFQTIAYALSVTTEVRGRRERYAQLEFIGLREAAGGEDTSSENISFKAISFEAPITIGGALRSADITRRVYRHTDQPGKMKSPVFVVFLKTVTP
ncbi:MAG: hypothetical protein LBR71_05100, partial [Synergistaceae bacterium]|nr:hypothetical protein [Synergistaceae bacterium]